MAMSNTVTAKKAIQQQASHWLQRLDLGLSRSEKQQLMAWADQSQQHRTSLFNQASLWDDLTILSELHSLFPQTISEQKANHWFNIAIAACITLVIGTGTGLLFGLNPFMTSDPALQLTQSRIYTTKIGEQKAFTLPDGSHIQLNTNSSVSAYFTHAKRTISLARGEATFEVAKDKHRPFTVTAGNRSFTALGTVFNVQKDSEQDMELTVTEGKVLITPAAQAIERIPDSFTSLPAQQLPGTLVLSGQKAVIKHNIEKPLQQISTDQVQRELAWQQGMLIFSGEPLSEALTEVSRYSATTFTLADDDIGHLKVAGYFKAGDIDGLLQSLHSNFALRYHKRGNTITLLAGTDEVKNPEAKATEMN